MVSQASELPLSQGAKSDDSKFARTAGLLFAVRVVGTGLSFCSQVILARLLGVESFGDYSYALALAYVLILVAKLGTDSGALRFVAAYRACDKWGHLRGYLRFAHRLTLVFFVLLAVLASITVLAIPGLDQQLRRVCLLAFVLVGPFALGELSAAGLQGLHRVIPARLLVEVGRPLIFITGLGLTWVLLDGLSPEQAMALNIVAAACIAVGSWGLIVRTLERRVAKVPPCYEKSEWLATSMQLGLITGLLLGMKQSDVIMIGYFAGTTDAGIYALVSKMATLAAFGLTAANALIAPRIAALFARNEMQQLQELISQATRLTAAVTVLLCTTLIVFRESALGLFGPEFARGDWALMALLSAQAINALMGPVGFLMTMTGNQAVVMKVMGGSALANIVLNLLLIPRWGMQGAAVATATSTILWNVGLAVLAHRKLGLRTLPL